MDVPVVGEVRDRDPVPTFTALMFATAFVLLRRGVVIILLGAGLSTWVERIMHGGGLEASIGPGQGPDLAAPRGQRGVLNFG